MFDNPLPGPEMPPYVRIENRLHGRDSRDQVEKDQNHYPADAFLVPRKGLYQIASHFRFRNLEMNPIGIKTNADVILRSLEEMSVKDTHPERSHDGRGVQEKEGKF